MSGSAEKNELTPSRTDALLRVSKRPGQEPWEMTWNGLTWQDMPNVSREHKLYDFALFRRGLYEVEYDQSDDADDADEPGVPKRRKLVKAQRCFGRIGTRRTVAAVAAARDDDGPVRAARQAVLLERYVTARLQAGFVKAFYDLDPTGHSAVSRAMGRSRSLAGPLRIISLDRIERAFETLNEGGWKV